MKEKNKIPVTVISGFLGAGKTTFINFLLKQFPETKFALVENEFGDVGIDSQLIKGMDASQMFELKNGCICCTITDEFELILKELYENFPDIEHLIIETTGLADPTAVIQPFFNDDELKEIFRYNGTICLLDALHFNTYPEKELTTKQLVVADLILVNKSELMDKEDTQYLDSTLKEMNPFATIKYVTYGIVEGLNLLNVKKEINWHLDVGSGSDKLSELGTKSLIFNSPLPKERFLHWLEYTIEIYKKEIYRLKGIVSFEDEPFEYIIQGVGGSFEIEEGNLILEKKHGKLVFIGKLEGLNLEFV